MRRSWLAELSALALGRNLRGAVPLGLAIASTTCALFAPVVARSEDSCAEVDEYQARINAQTPLQIDAVTVLLQIRANCTGRAVTYVKQLVQRDDEMLDGWKDRKLTQHHQLHCNAVGLARQGWTVIDILYDADMHLLSEFRTVPGDC